MNEELLNKSDFANNKFYNEIVKVFINELPKENTRVVINKDNIYVKAPDATGHKIIDFRIIDGNLRIKIDKNINLRKYQDILVYDDYGVMIERSSCQAILKSDVNDNFQDNPNVLVEEFEKLGQNTSIYTGKIFDRIDLKKAVRPKNYSLNGTYSHKLVQCDDKGQMVGNRIEGTFNILNSNSISTFEIPKDEDIEVTKEELLIDNEAYAYREPIKFR